MCILYMLGRDPCPYDYRNMQFSLSPKFSTDKFDFLEEMYQDCHNLQKFCHVNL